METLVAARSVPVRGGVARVFVGGDGPALVLVHGGWGGAAMHWSRVWDRLAERHRVVAPDLPGLGQPEVPALGSVAAYAAWLVALLDALGIERASWVGNSFGASVAWSIAGRTPARCERLVLVNGFAMPSTPTLLARLGRTAAGAALLRAVLRRFVYAPRALGRAFVDPARAPEELRATLQARGAGLVPAYAQILVAGDGPPAPRAAPLLLWGEGDHLPATSAADARRLQASLPGATLRFVPNAGHFPELEAPEVFVRELEAFVG